MTAAIPHQTPVDDTDIDFMRRALDWARRGAAEPGGNPLGCVIVLDGEIIGEGHNEVDARHDPTAHAEVVAIRRACEKLGAIDLQRATLYSTLQPCGMCSMASIWARIGRIVYGAGRQDVHRMYFEGRNFDTVDFLADAFRDDLPITGGVLEAECTALYNRPGDAVPVEDQTNI